MAKTPGAHPTNTGYGRFIGRVGGLAVALGIGVAIANNPGIAAADDGQAPAKETTSAASESPNSNPSTPDSNPVKTAVKELRSSITEAREKADSTRENFSSRLQTRRSQRETSESSNVQATQIVKSTPKPPKPAPNPALVAIAGFVRRETEHAVTPARTHESVAPSAAVTRTFTTAADSPLGTPEQLDAEQTATETVNTLPVQVMKVVLKAGWYVTALSEFHEVGGPDKENLAQLSRSVDEYAMGAAFQQQILNPMTPRAVMQVAPPHTWYGQSVGGSRILYDNPDTVYRFMAVNKTSTYVIRGKFEDWDPENPDNFGSNPKLPADTTFSLLTGLSGNTADVIEQDELVVDENGEFEILVSGAPRPVGYEGNYLQLTSDSTLIAARDTLADWNNEQPMTLEIERVSGPPNSLLAQLGIFAIPLIGPAVTDSPALTQLVSIIPPLADPPPLLRGAVTSVIMVLGLSMEREYMRVATVDSLTGEHRPPNEFTNPTSNAAFLDTQLQSAGYFQLEDDDALVVTIDPGDAGYFVVPVTNDWTITENYWDQQTSLNNASNQAKPNADGTYTIVISKNDPGVANWVSTGGLNQGTVSIRFQDLGDEAPMVSSKVVKIENLRNPDVLPADTVFIEPEDLAAYRAAQIATRHEGFNNRFAPFPQT
jgi:TolA-binding protein